MKGSIRFGEWLFSEMIGALLARIFSVELGGINIGLNPPIVHWRTTESTEEPAQTVDSHSIRKSGRLCGPVSKSSGGRLFFSKHVQLLVEFK